MAVFCVIDGMTDRAFSFDNYPHMRAMRDGGACGLLNTTPSGMRADTLPCTLTLLGLPQRRIPDGARTWFEAAACGVAAGPGDLLLRCNLVKLDGAGRLASCCAADLPPGRAREMAAGFPVHNIGGYKNILVLPDAASQKASVVTYPPHQCVGTLLKDRLPSGPGLPELVAESGKRLSPYLLWPWAPSVFTRLPQIREKAAAVCAAQIVRGIARLAGFVVPALRRATGDTDTDLTEKADATVALSREYPLVFLHINGADEAAHRLDGAGKEAFLKRVDSLVLPKLMSSGQPVLIASDHGCSPVTGAHLPDAQPFLLYGTPESGDLGLFDGTEALTLLTGRHGFLWD